MGADMLIEAISLKKEQEPKWPDSVTRKHAIDYIKNYLERIVDFSNVEAEEELEIESEIKDVISQLTDDMEEVKRQLSGDYSREITSLSYPERDIWLTGGMSWGDEPTQLFDVFSRLWASGILEEAGFE